MAQSLCEEDKKRDKIFLLVIPNEEGSTQKLLIKAKEVICPECKEPSLMKIKDYKISIYDCKNKHKKDNISLDEYEKTQNIDVSKIICDKCKKNIKEEESYKQFCLCITCKMNLCSSCKNKHDKNHNIIKYELKNYICSEHGDNYYSYCKTCGINLCMVCENDHEEHDVKSFRKLLPKTNDLKSQLSKLKEYINKLKNEINEIKKKLDNILENFEKYYKINDDIISSYNIKNKNYEILHNISAINHDQVINDINEIINENDISNKCNKIMNLYNQMDIKEIKKNKEINENNNNESNNNDNNMNIMINNNIDINSESYKRLKEEYEDLLSNPNNIGLKVELFNKNNIYEWKATLLGPKDTSYSGGLFFLKAIFPKDYPENPPDLIHLIFSLFFL